jgi:hypothetical protein
MSQATNIITLPVKKLAFSADDFMGVELLTKYDANRTFVVFCQRFLECSPEQMKKKIAALEAHDGLDSNTVVQHLIDDFEALVVEYEALSHLFDSAAARLTAVHRGLI